MSVGTEEARQLPVPIAPSASEKVQFPQNSTVRRVDSLKPNPCNARTHSDKQVATLAAAIQKFGFLAPIIIDEDGVILAGHGRYAAARLLGLEYVPVILVSHLTAAKKRAYVLADNRLAELAGWDEELLAVELQEIELVDPDLPIEITGFDAAFIEGLLDKQSPREAAKVEVIPPIDRSVPAVSRLGDLWMLGPHRLLCGNATEEIDVARLMGGDQAQMVISDVPYNVKIDGHVCGLGKVKHREFAMAAGELSPEEFVDFLRTAFALLAASSLDGSIHFIFIDWRHLRELFMAGYSVYSELKNLIVWNKSNGGMGTFYRSKHELICAWKKGTAKHINTFGLGDKGRYRTNVWDYAGVNTFRAGREKELEAHPTVKPLAMIIDAIKDCSLRKGIILDTFAGSGTVILAAERTGRVARALEIDPHYVDVAIRRWEDMTGAKAVHAETGLVFAAMAELRKCEAATSDVEQRHV